MKKYMLFIILFSSSKVLSAEQACIISNGELKASGIKSAVYYKDYGSRNDYDGPIVGIKYYGILGDDFTKLSIYSPNNLSPKIIGRNYGMEIEVRFKYKSQYEQAFKFFFTAAEYDFPKPGSFGYEIPSYYNGRVKNTIGDGSLNYQYRDFIEMISASMKNKQNYSCWVDAKFYEQ